MKDLLVRLDESQEPHTVWKDVVRSAQTDGYRGMLAAGVDDLPRLQGLARDLLVSLEFARPGIRRGELFEALFFRLVPTYLERTYNELISGLLRLNLTANCSAAIDRAGAMKRTGISAAEKAAR